MTSTVSENKSHRTGHRPAKQLIVLMLFVGLWLGPVASPVSAAAPGRGYTETGCEGYSDSVVRLYTAAFGRMPEQAGFEYWMTEYTHGNRNLTSMADFFTKSPEFLTTYGPLDDDGFVRQLYRNVLGRNGEETGVSYWINEMVNGMARRTVLLRFAESPENITRSGTTEPILGPYNEGRSGRWRCDERFNPSLNDTFTIIGDSVMAGATQRGILTNRSFGGWSGTVDARECRHALVGSPPGACGSATFIPGVLGVIREAAAAGTIGDVVVIHTGTNGPFAASGFDELVRAAVGAEEVWFINVRNGRSWEPEINRVLDSGVARWSSGGPFVGLLDWHGLSVATPGLLADDGIHLTPSGAESFTAMIRKAIPTQ